MLHLSAQSNKISIQGGVTGTSFSSSLMSEQKLKFGDTYHLGYERETESKLLLSVGVSYISMGTRITNTGIDGLVVVEDLNLIEFENTLDFNYISIPLKVGKRIGDDFFGFGYLGVSNRFLLTAIEDRPRFDSNLEIIGRQKEDITKDVKRFDFAGLISLGFGKKFSNHEVFLSSSFTFSATSFETDNFLTGLNPRNYGGILKIGYNYRF